MFGFSTLPGVRKCLANPSKGSSSQSPQSFQVSGSSAQWYRVVRQFGIAKLVQISPIYSCWVVGGTSIVVGIVTHL